MKLLFDENLSPNLVELLNEAFPGSVHVHGVQLGATNDNGIWRFALEQQFFVVTKDSDFAERCAAARVAPKTIWLRTGNCPTALIAQILLASRERLEQFGEEPDRRWLALHRLVEHAAGA